MAAQRLTTAAIDERNTDADQRGSSASNKQKVDAENQVIV